MVQNNLLALVITFLVALAWLRANNFAAQRGWVSSDLSRKIIHMGTGLLFVLCWLLFEETPTARFLAASVPLALDVAIRDGRIKPGEMLLMEAFGGGFTWGSVLVRY